MLLIYPVVEQAKGTGRPVEAVMLTMSKALMGFFAGVIASVATPALAQQPARIESRFAEANGIRLHYLAAGKGNPIFLLHGYAQNSHMWRPLIAKLAKTNTVIAPDLRGFGQSEKPPQGYDKKTMAQDIHALAQALGLRRVRLAGHDIGLMVAYAYAAQNRSEEHTSELQSRLHLVCRLLLEK